LLPESEKNGPEKREKEIDRIDRGVGVSVMYIGVYGFCGAVWDCETLEI
jgi:hypothetical protein